MAHTYTPEELAAIAKQRTEQAIGAAVRWWVEQDDPTTLHVLAEVRLLHGGILAVHLRAPLPEQ
jgi:hypothetical protein